MRIRREQDEITKMGFVFKIPTLTSSLWSSIQKEKLKFSSEVNKITRRVARMLFETPLQLSTKECFVFGISSLVLFSTFIY